MIWSSQARPFCRPVDMLRGDLGVGRVCALSRLLTRPALGLVTCAHLPANLRPLRQRDDLSLVRRYSYAHGFVCAFVPLDEIASRGPNNDESLS